MLKSELIQKLVESVTQTYPEMTEKAVTECSQEILSLITDTLKNGGRMEVRGFGSLDVSYCPSRKARDPRTGNTVQMSARHKVRFRPSKKLKLRLNASYR